MKWLVGIVIFVILSLLLDGFNSRLIHIEERMSKLEEALEPDRTNEDE